MLFAGKGLSDGKKKAQDALYGFCGEKKGNESEYRKSVGYTMRMFEKPGMGEPLDEISVFVHFL